MRVLALVHNYLPRQNAGAEWMLHTLLRDLARRGHSCAVATSQPAAATEPDEIDVDGVTVYQQKAKRRAPRLAATADVLITHLDQTENAARLARAAGVPLVQLVHNDLRLTPRYLAAGCDLAVFNSRWLADRFACWPGRKVIIRPPVIVGDYATKPGDRVTLINLNQAKGADLFWRLAERMADRRFLGVRGAYGHQIVRHLPNVEIRQQSSRMREVYSQTRVLLVPSSYESWGRVAVEAIASGIPVIAHPTPGLQESLAGAGTFVDRDQVHAWERELRRLENPAAYQQASSRALERSRELDPKPDLDLFERTLQEVTGAPAQT